MTDNRPVCTADRPALPTKNKYGRVGWNSNYRHPDATETEISDVHEDYRYDCPHCGGRLIVEGPDA